MVVELLLWAQPQGEKTATHCNSALVPGFWYQAGIGSDAGAGDKERNKIGLCREAGAREDRSADHAVGDKWVGLIGPYRHAPRGLNHRGSGIFTCSNLCEWGQFSPMNMT